MSGFRCPTCGAESDVPFCMQCRKTIVPEGQAATTAAEPPRPPGPIITPIPPELLPKSHERPTGDEDIPKRPPRPKRSVFRTPEPVLVEEEPEAGEGASARMRGINYEDLNQFLKHNYELIFVGGLAKSGKSQMMKAAVEIFDPGAPNQIRVKGKAPSQAEFTPAGALSCYPLRWKGRDVAFVDISGEDFKNLSPSLSGKRVKREDIEFLSSLSRNLTGVVLMVHVQRLLGESTPYEAENEMKSLIWSCQLLRWIRFCDPNKLSEVDNFEKQVVGAVAGIRRRLDVPVLVVLSQADIANGVWVPGLEREMFPLAEQPVLFAKHCLKPLFDGVMTHCDHFHFDFAHSLVMEPATESVIDKRPLGLEMALDWTLSRQWKRRWYNFPSVPARYWLALAEFFDNKFNDGGRWSAPPLNHPDT